MNDKIQPFLLFKLYEYNPNSDNFTLLANAHMAAF